MASYAHSLELAVRDRIRSVVYSALSTPDKARRCDVRPVDGRPPPDSAAANYCGVRWTGCSRIGDNRMEATVLDHAVDRRWRECFSQWQRLGHAHNLVLVVFAKPVHVECGRPVGNPSPEQRKF